MVMPAGLTKLRFGNKPRSSRHLGFSSQSESRRFECRSWLAVGWSVRLQARETGWSGSHF